MFVLDPPWEPGHLVDEAIANAIGSVKAHFDNKPRTLLSGKGHLGPSDVGGCRRRARYQLDQIKSRPSEYWLGAAVGTAFHVALASAQGEQALCEVPVVADLGDGITVAGTADMLVPEARLVIDWKTVGNFNWLNRQGNHQHRLQVALYALGASQEGHWGDGALTGAIVYWDRSGATQEPFVDLFPVTDELLADAKLWLLEVYKATGPDYLPRDEVPSKCFNLCPFVTTCRGGELVADDFATAEVLEAVERIKEIRKLVTDLEAEKKHAETLLDYYPGGTLAGFKVSWSDIPAKEMAPYLRRGYRRLNITKIPKAMED